MTTWQYIFLLLGIPILIFGAFKSARIRGPTPVKLTSCDELNAISDTVVWAQRQVGPDDPRRKGIAFLYVYMVGTTFPFAVRLSTKDLEVLAPFIDKFIEGKGPPLNLPSEYEDWRPAVLSDFKARMKNERLWPASS
jgi:hypothetical protein